jgi:signal transduction histidine kinase/CheY-like chemotaxis protein
MLAYREVCYIDVARDRYQIVYPEPKDGDGEGRYQAEIGRIINEDTTDAEEYKAVMEFLSLKNIKKELADKEYAEIRCHRRDESGVEEACIITVTVTERKGGKLTEATLAIRSIENMLRKEEAQRELLTITAQRAEAANNAKSDFLSNISHDIRTPMNAILGMTAIAAMNIDDKERIKDALNKITLSGKHLLGLINSVLDMSKIESGKLSLNDEEFNIAELIENLTTLMNTQIKAKQLELRVNIANVVHEDVIGDAQRLQQIFVNIMGNAIKFTPEGGMITLTISEKSSKIIGRGCYEFIFEDNGIGMQQEFVERIFEPFTRAADSRVAKVEGTGLGMPIAINVARMMGGNIEVESELGKGSKFTVSVYLKINDVTEDTPIKFNDLAVLVVDDEEYACVNACEILNSMNMVAQYVLSGDEAVIKVSDAHVANDDFALVILDWKMPGKDGIETTREIRRIMGAEIPIIILSGYDWTDIEQEAVAAGVNAFIEKPLFKSRLTHVLKEVLGLTDTEQTERVLESYRKHSYRDKRILLVEDNELNIEVASELLNVIGCNVEIVNDGKEAVEKVAEMPIGYYDLIFMDIQMPYMNGYEATVEIRNMKREDLKNIPIIAMTADAFTDDVVKAAEAGMNGHIAKPIDITTLENTLSKWL